MTAPDAVHSALNEHRPGHALPGTFAIDSSIFAHELEVLWRASWLFVGPSAEAPAPGDFFRFDLGRHSLLIVRGEDGVLRALHNTCRHRGMPLSVERAGRVKRWVCPYHQWAYSLDGTLLGCGGMEEQIERAEHGLLKAPIVELGGLVFVWIGASAPDDPGQAISDLAPALAPQGLTRARVAKRIDYQVAANWKLVWENNRECWHCHVGHPDYVKANFDAAPDTPAVRRSAQARAEEHARAMGGHRVVTGTHAAPGLYAFPSPERWWSANRTPLVPGFVTESLDGRPVAPLMGEYQAYDVGTLRVRTLPNFWCHASSDHAVLTRLAPDGPERTEITVWWLVDEHAVEGRDYELDRLLPFWQLTSEQDWRLCELNHSGVSNPAFIPGPYSLRREQNVLAFIEWYLERITP